MGVARRCRNRPVVLGRHATSSKTVQIERFIIASARVDLIGELDDLKGKSNAQKTTEPIVPVDAKQCLREVLARPPKCDTKMWSEKNG